MRRTPFLLTVGLGLVSAGAPAQQKTAIPAQAPSPAAVSPIPAAASAALARAVALYGDGAAHVASFTQIHTPSGFATTRRESGTVVIQAQRVRFDYIAPEKKVFTFDAGEGRFFSPEDKQLTVRRLSEEEKARLPIVFLTQPADLGKHYEITVEPGEAAASSTRLLLTPRVPSTELAWLRLVIDGSGNVGALSYQDSAGNRTEFRFEGWRAGKARPAADFRITGPPGTRIVEN